MNSNKHILKGLLATALGIMMLTGCQDDELAPKPGEGSEGELIEVNAALPGEEVQTRTIMGGLQGDVYPVLWEDNDKIGISNSSAISSFTLNTGTGTKYGTFIGTGSAPVAGTSYYAACYPYAGGKMSKANNELIVGGVIPTNQKYQESRKGSFEINAYPMASVSSQKDDFQFYNLAGVLQLNIKGTGTIKRIILTGNDSEDVAGGVAMHFDTNTGEPKGSTDTSWSTIKMSSYETKGLITFDLGDAGIVLNANTPITFNIAIAPQTFKKGFSLRIIDKNGGTFEKKTNQPVTIKRSYTRVMADFNYETPEPLETANSYIISEAGYYTIPAFCMGNRQGVRLYSHNGKPATGVAGYYKDIALPDDKDLAAAVLWTDVEGLGNDALTAVVSDVEFIPAEDGKGSISFKLNKDMSGQPYRGNVAVCLYNKNEKDPNTGLPIILWSWHLWLTENPEVVYTDGSCVGGKYRDTETNYTFIADATDGSLAIMDRNLGAISATPADGWKTYGLYYQMGRKDPFIGGKYSGNYNKSANDNMSGDENFSPVYQWETTAFSSTGDNPTHWTVANNELTKGWKHNNGYINLTTSIRNPMTFSAYDAFNSRNTSNTKWTNYSDSDNKKYLDKFPNDVFNSTLDHTTGLKTQNFESYWNRTKTIFDPCPAGWTVLGADGVNSNSASKVCFFSKSSNIASVNSNNTFGVKYRATYNNVTYTTWWPAAGFRTTRGTMADVGFHGAYFFFDHIDNSHGGHGVAFKILGTGFDIDICKTGYNKILPAIMTNHACPIRCVSASQPWKKQ